MSLASVIFVKGSLVLLLAAIICFLLRGASATLRHWVWCLAFLGLALAMGLPRLVPAWEIELPDNETPRELGASEPLPPAPSAIVSERSPSIPWRSSAYRMWWLGLALLLVKTALDLAALASMRARSVQLAAGERAVDSLRRRPNGAIEIRSGPHVPVPMAFGWSL